MSHIEPRLRHAEGAENVRVGGRPEVSGARSEDASDPTRHGVAVDRTKKVLTIGTRLGVGDWLQRKVTTSVK